MSTATTPDSLTISSHPNPLPAVVAGNADTILHNPTLREEGTDHTALLEIPALPRAPSRPSSSRLLKALRHALTSIPILAIALFSIVLLEDHISWIRYQLQLPAFCRKPGMEAYRYTSHCQLDLSKIYPHLARLKASSFDVKFELLDGPPPKPIRWADFQRLYQLQDRMIEHMLNASLSDGATVLKSINREVDDKNSLLYRLRMEVQRRDYMKERVLRDTMHAAGSWGRHLDRMYERTMTAVRKSLDLNQKALRAVEGTIDKQPKSFLAQAIVPLFPRRREIYFWAWGPDFEARWRFYNSLTSFSWTLYNNLVDLVDLQQSFEAFGEEVEVLLALLAEEKKEQTAPPVKTPFFTWPKSARQADKGGPKSNEDEEYEESKEKMLNRLAKARHVALDRLGCALTALRALSEELEGVRHSVAQPGPRLPTYVHLKHMYVGGERLQKMLEKMKSLGTRREG